MKRTVLVSIIAVFAFLTASVDICFADNTQTAGGSDNSANDVLNDITKILDNFKVKNCKVIPNQKIVVPENENPYIKSMKDYDPEHPEKGYLLAQVIICDEAQKGKPQPTILMYSAYNKIVCVSMMAPLAGYGYNLVILEPRGTGSTPGKWYSMGFPEQWDMKYVIDKWIPSQTWSDGTVGTFGGSYMAIVQMLVAALVDKDEKGVPLHLKAIFPQQGGSDGYADIAMQGGSMDIEFMMVYLTLTQTMRLVPNTMIYDPDNFKDIQDAFNQFQKKEGTLWEGLQTWFNSFGTYSDPFYEYMLESENDVRGDFLWQLSPMIYWPDKPADGFKGLNDKFGESKRIYPDKLPTFMIAGWYDIFLRGTLNQYTYGMKNIKPGDKGMIIGEWYHNDVIPNFTSGISTFADMTFMKRWFDWKLKGTKDSFSREFPVLMYVMGENRWRAEKDWPLPASRLEKRSFYLSKAKPKNLIANDSVMNSKNTSLYSLVESKEKSDLKSKNPVIEHSFKRLYGWYGRSVIRWSGGFPAIPTQMMKHLWGNDVDAKMGYEDERKDETGIPTWTTEPLENDLEITGPTTLYFWAKTDFIEGTFIDKAKLDILMSLLKKTLDLDNDNDFFERLMRSNDVQWSVRMNDVFPDGRSKNITQGWIRASCRPYDPNEASGVKEHSLDPAYVPYDPFYLRPTETPKPINEGQLYQYAIEILPTGNVFKKGHRIRIDLANSDFPHLLPILTPSNNTIVIDDAHEARIDYTTVNTNDEGKTWKWITKPGEKGYSKDFTSFDQYLMKNVDPEEKTEPSPVPEEAQQPSSSDEKSGWCFISASQFLK